MATFDQIVTISNDPGFRGRVFYALNVAARAVYSESSGTTGHAARAAYASRVLNSNSIPYGVILGVLANSTILAEANSSTTPDFGIPDADIQFQVNSMWNALAGA